MNHSKIALRYSRALFDSALDKKILEKVYADMLLIQELCTLPDIKEFLESPVIVPSKKIVILREILNKEIDNLTIALVDLVVRNGRELFLPDIARAFIHQTKEHYGITETLLTTAVKVNDKIRKEITDLISGVFKTKVEIKEVVDKEIIGGFILRIEDNYIDASVRNKLRKIEKELKGVIFTEF
jgi:F-type H+-transporting ATPase subunit delta